MPGVTQITRAGRSLQEKKQTATAAGLGLPKPGESASAGVQGAYLHVPFCFHKCHYCDFYSLVDTRDRQEAFTRRLVDELAAARGFITGPVRTVFVGGGTPTLLAPGHWARLLDALQECLPLTADGELTVEANPETVTAELARLLAAGSVNRVSIGAQSFHPTHLRTLERWHEPASVARALDHFRASGIENVNLDLIFAIPGQSLADWMSDLETALSLEPEHLSCYGLVYEPNTPLTARRDSGQIVPVEDDLEARMYEAATDVLASHGFEQYEISNWARPGRRCRHNVLYWTNGSWWPFGPSAAGHVSGTRWKNVRRLDAYLQSDGLPSIQDVEQLDDDARVGESLMLGLRMIEGIACDRLANLFASGARGEERAAAVETHLDSGLLERTATHLRLTRRGRLLADIVLRDLI